MAAREIAVIIKAKDAASPVFRSMSGRLGKLGGVAKTALGVGLGIVGVKAIGAVVGGMTSAIDVAADFESQMNILGVAARSAGTGMDDLRQASIAVGADAKLVGISASEAADAITNFYKAGLSTADIFQDLNGYLAGTVELGGALRTSIDLSAASTLDLAAASDAVNVAMATFDIKASEATRIADSFVGAADASVAEVIDLVAAMENLGPTAAQFGWAFEDVNTALAIMSTRGIRGAEAGTALRSMMTNMMRPTDAVKEALNELGVSLYDREGELKTLPNIIADLSKAFEGTITTTKTLGGATKAQKKEMAGYSRQIASAKKALEEYQAGIRGTSMKEKTRAKRVAELTKKIAFYEKRLKGVNVAELKTVKSVKKLTEEQKNQKIQTLAGTYGMKAMATLLSEGTEGWEEMAEAIEKAATAQEVAEARTRGYQGALEQFKGVIETIKIVIGTPILERFLTPAIKALGEFFGIAATKGPQIEKFFDGLAGALGKVSEGAEGLWAKTKPYFDEIIPGLKKWWRRLVSSSTLKNIRKEWPKALAGSEKAIWEGLEPWFDYIESGITDWWDYLRTGGALAEIREGWAEQIGGPTQWLWDTQLKPWFDYIDEGLWDWWVYFRSGGALAEIREGWATYIGGPTDYLWKQLKPWFDYIETGVRSWWGYFRSGAALTEIREGWATYIGGPTDALWKAIKPWWDYIDTELFTWWTYFRTGGALGEIRDGWATYIGGPTDWLWKEIAPWFDYIDTELSAWWTYLRTGGALAEIREGWATYIGGPTDYLWTQIKPWFDYIDTELSAWWKYLHTGGALKEIREGWKLHIADPLSGFWKSSGLEGHFDILTLQISTWAQTAYGWISTHLIENLKKLPADVRTIWAEMRTVAEEEAGKDPKVAPRAGLLGLWDRLRAAFTDPVVQKRWSIFSGILEAIAKQFRAIWDTLKLIPKALETVAELIGTTILGAYLELTGGIEANEAATQRQWDTLRLWGDWYTGKLVAIAEKFQSVNRDIREGIRLVEEYTRALQGVPSAPAWTYAPTPRPRGSIGDTRGPGYQFGGIVPGPIGVPRLATVHGGEVITPPGRGRQRRPGVHIDFRGAHFYGIDETMVEELFEEERVMRALRGIKRSEY